MNVSAKYHLFCNITLKEGPKVKICKKKLGTKSWRKILEGLKRKVGIFIETKNIFNFTLIVLNLSDVSWISFNYCISSITWGMSSEDMS